MLWAVRFVCFKSGSVGSMYLAVGHFSRKTGDKICTLILISEVEESPTETETLVTRYSYLSRHIIYRNTQKIMLFFGDLRCQNFMLH